MPETSADAQALIDADAEFRAAVIASDPKRLGPLLAEGFVYIHSSGLEDSRTQFLDRVGGGGPVVYVQREVKNLATRIQGDAGALTGHTFIGFRRGDSPVEIRGSNFLSAWAREAGGWRMMAYCGAPLES